VTTTQLDKSRFLFLGNVNRGLRPAAFVADWQLLTLLTPANGKAKVQQRKGFSTLETNLSTSLRSGGKEFRSYRNWLGFAPILGELFANDPYASLHFRSQDKLA